MNRHSNTTGAFNSSRDWKETFADVLMLISLVLFGVAAGIGLCKFWPEFWYFVNWGLNA